MLKIAVSPSSFHHMRTKDRIPVTTPVNVHSVQHTETLERLGWGWREVLLLLSPSDSHLSLCHRSHGSFTHTGLCGSYLIICQPPHKHRPLLSLCFYLFSHQKAVLSLNPLIDVQSIVLVPTWLWFFRCAGGHTDTG